RARVWNSQGSFVLPEDGDAVFGTDHPFLDEVRHDTVALVQNRFAGHLVLSGWTREKCITFAEEHGSHGGPGRAEVQGFALLPAGATGDAAGKGYLRPCDIHRLALAARPPVEQAAAAVPEERPALPEAS
ncbi:MAG: hypothetical protein IT368_06920, partial [Candidatus Hydrogenedentes bacterium]|nr:hypothetical protein [Candidatus Hydrogenedentota bacterium]